MVNGLGDGTEPGGNPAAWLIVAGSGASAPMDLTGVWVRISGRRAAVSGVVAVAVSLVVGGCSSPAMSASPGRAVLTTYTPAPVMAPPQAAARRAEAIHGWAASLTTGLPADLPGASVTPTCHSTDQAAGWLARENARPGDPHWRVAYRGVTPRVVGYLGQTTAVCGDTVTVHLSSPGDRAVIRVLRVGWYHGAGARLVWTSPVVDVQPQPQARPSGPTRLVQESWPTTTTIPITSAFPPGLYLVEFVSLTDHSVGAAPLVVRDPAAPAPIVMQLSAATWAAYNTYGGASLYHGPGGLSALRAFQAGLDRPLVGDGLRELMVRDVALAHQVERLGVDTAYLTDFDVDAHPSWLLTHREIIIPGHAEYWTLRMVHALEAARNAGINQAWLGANVVSWQIRIARTADGQPTGVICYRTFADPVAATEPVLATVRFYQDPGPAVDVGALVGQRYAGIKMVAGLRVRTAPAWLVAGTGLHVGSLLPGVIANEADGVQTMRGLPPDLQVIAEGAFHRGGLLWAADMTYYTAPSGAAVFSAGTTDFGCEIDGSCADHHLPGAEAALLQRLTANLVRAFAEPGFGRAHPSATTPPTPLATLVHLIPAVQVGTAGRPE